MEITINQAGRFYDDFPNAFCRSTETEEDEFRACFFDQKPIVNRDASLFKEKINVGACAYMKWNFGGKCPKMRQKPDGFWKSPKRCQRRDDPAFHAPCKIQKTRKASPFGEVFHTYQVYFA